LLTLWGQIEDWLKPVVRRLRPPAARGAGGAKKVVVAEVVVEPLVLFEPKAQATARVAAGRSAVARAKGRVAAVAADRASAASEVESARGEAESAQDRYDRVVRAMLQEHGVRVRRWRSSMSGVAWEIRYSDGSIARLIEAPKPKGPMSAAIFLHEIGHHAIGFNRYKPRCLEEYHAWAWSLRAMESHGLAVTDSVKHRMAESLWYAVAKARRRGIKELPTELMAFTTRPPRRHRGRGARER
jgi:hypothetical protein